MQNKWQRVFTTTIWEHVDSNASFLVMSQKDDDVHVQIQPLLDAAQFIDALYLSGVPFLIVYSDFEGEAFDIGWGVQLALIEDWADVIESRSNSMVLAFDYDNPLDVILDGVITDEYETNNLHLFFIRNPPKGA